MRRLAPTSWLLALGLAGQPPTVHADPPRPSVESALETQVTAAVAALSAPRLEERRAAEATLIQLGPAALLLLPPPDLVTTAATREALRRVRIHLETAAATKALQPTTVSLTGNVNTADFAAQIQRQTQFELQLAPELRDSPRRFPVALDRVTAWQAIEQLTREAGGRWRFDGLPSRLQIEATSPSASRPPTVDRQQATPGSLNVRVLAIEQKATESGRILRVQFGLAAEPRLRPLLIRYAMADLTATTGTGETIPAWNPNASYELAAGIAGREWPLAAEFLFPPHLDPKILNLKGQLQLMVATGTKEITFTHWYGGRRTLIRRGGATATLRRTRIRRDETGQDQAEAEVLLTYDTDAPPLESHQRWVLHQDAVLRRTDGVLIPFTRSEVSEEQTGGLGVTYTFAGIANLRETELIYRPATAVLQTTVEFELAGIEIGTEASPTRPGGTE